MERKTPPLPRNIPPPTPPKDEIQGLLESRAQALSALENAVDFEPARAFMLVESALELSFGLYSDVSFAPFVHKLLKVAGSITLKMIGTQPPLAPILRRIRAEEINYTAAHSLLLAEICCAIASKMGWESEPTFSKLISAAFLHDITLGNHKIARFQKVEDLIKSKAFTDDEIEIFRKHPDQASKYARELIGSPAELETILAQHHEQADGSGFPLGLLQRQLNPLSCLFILAHDLLNFYLDNAPTAQWEQWIKISSVRYRSGVFNKIIKQLSDE